MSTIAAFKVQINCIPQKSELSTQSMPPSLGKDTESSIAQHKDSSKADSLPTDRPEDALGPFLDRFPRNDPHHKNCNKDHVLELEVPFTADTDPFRDDWPFW
jgi:hypothetical protein